MSFRTMLATAAVFGMLAAGCERPQVKVGDVPPEEVLISMPTTDEVTDYEDFIGHTDAIYSVDIRARVNGYLDKVNFNDGDEVEKGATLFEIDSRPYKATFDNAMAMVEQAKAHFDRTTKDHNRAVALLERNAIGREEFDRIQGDYAESKATIGAVKATMETAQLNLDWTKVTSPISGLISRRLVDPGNLVKADDTLLSNIVSLDPIYVYFDIDERTLLKIRRLIAEGRVKSRREAELPVLIGLADEPNFPHTGIINFSDNKVDAATGTLRLRGIIANPKPRLFSPGLFVRIRLPVGVPHQSVLISEQAVGTDQGRKFVYVVRSSKVKDKKTNQEREAEVVFSQDVKVGALNNGLRVIDKGIALGDRVVVSGLQRVRPGKEVAPRLLADFEKSMSKSATKVAAADSAHGTPPTQAVAATPTSPASPGAAKATH